MKNVDDLLPLAPLQELMFAHALAEPHSSLLIEHFRATLAGALDVAALREAWQAVAARHAMLRAAPAWEGLKKAVLVVRRQIEVPWQELDWRTMSDDEQQRELATLLDDDRRQGFDLAKAPLWRVRILRLSDARWQLLWTCHHLVLDGWSLGIVLREVFSAYAQLQQGDVPRLAPAGSFRDYHAWLGQQDTAAAERFWQEQLAGWQPTRALPIERQPFEPPSADRGHAEIERRLSTAATAKLQEVARGWRAGGGAIVQAACAVLLGRYFEREEVLFGTAVAGRPHAVPRVDTIVGPFVNNVPLRIRVALQDRVSEFCARLQQAGTAAQPHEHVSLEQISRAAGITDGRPLFDTLVVFENYPLGETSSRQVGDLLVSDLHGSTTSAYPLTFIAVLGEAWRLRLLYDRQRYDDTTASRLLEQMSTLLECMSERPDARVGELSLAAKEECAPTKCAGVDLQVLDFAGQPAPCGMPGELCVAADNLTPRRLAYRAVRTHQGGLEYLGAQAAPLRVGRYSVDPREVASVLELHSLVARAAVVAHVNRAGQSQLAAYVLPRGEARLAIDSREHGLLVGELQRFAAKRLPAHMVPRAWRVLDALPLDAQGEIDLAALREPVRARGATSHPYVAPRDATEARVASIWSEVLGVEPIGVTDSFLDLGGYSSLAVTLLARLEDEFAWRLPLAALFEKPTVAHLAGLLRGDAATPEEVSLVPLRSSGAQAPLFCVHPAGGTVFCYLDLARQLGGDRPVYGLQAAGIHGATAPHETVEAMAAHYANAIHAVQPVGPYHLCGWSTGGVVAFELARQLREAREEVALLALFDAAIARPGESFGADDLLPMLELLFPTDDRQELERLREMPASAQLEHFRHRAEMAQLLVSNTGASQVERIYEVFQANMQAVIAYRPRSYDRKVTLFRAADHATPMHADRLLGWGPYATAGIDLHEVAAEHLTMLQSPTVSTIAERLNQILSTCGMAHQAQPEPMPAHT